MDSKAEKRLLEDVRAIRRLLEVLVKRTGPESPDVTAQLREALEEKPKGLYDGVGGFLDG